MRLVNLVGVFESNDRRRLFWRLQITGWSTTLLIGVGMLAYWPAIQVFLLGVFRAVFGFAVTSFVLRPVLQSIRRQGRNVRWRAVALLFLLCGLLAITDTVAVGELARLMGLELHQPGMRQFLSMSVVLRWVLYGFWCILYIGILYWLDTQQAQLRLAQTEAAMRASELQTLRAQVNPHFLFNALNSILAESHNAAAVQRITLALAEYLRFSLRQRNDTDLLGVELGALENYLRVEKARFEEKLEYVIEADTASREVQAPVALIQPLLENAIKYGQRSSTPPLRIAITGTVLENKLIVSVKNSGRWVEAESGTSTGTGLTNLRRRLELLYDGRARLTITRENEEVCAQVEIPTQSPESL